jgi:hypothetical protein
MRKVVRILPPVLALLLVATMAQAATAPKPGALCDKAEQTITVSNKKYTCVKSGKKLVWNKGVVIPSPTVKELTYETELSPINLAAYKEFIKSYKSRLTSEVPNIEFIVEPNMDKVLLKQIVDNINVSAKFFAKERPLNVPLKIWIAMSSQFQWIYDNMKEVLPARQLDGGWLDMKLARSKAVPDPNGKMKKYVTFVMKVQYQTTGKHIYRLSLAASKKYSGKIMSAFTQNVEP